MIGHIQSWVREVGGLGPDAAVEVREEAHCPDPACPLRRTTLVWSDAAGKSHRASIIKPLAYVRPVDVERAMRLFLTKS